MNNDMKELMAKSTNPLLQNMAEEVLRADINAGAALASNLSPKLSAKPSAKAAVSSSSKNAARSGSFVSKLKEDSISKQFTVSLKCLFETLDLTEPHFIRCLKPNGFKRSEYFNSKETLLQLKYAGMFETIRIRQQGFALRLFHKDFFYKYSRLMPSCATVKELVEVLSRILMVSAESWQVGTTKIFIRRDMSEKIDRLLWLRYSFSARSIQKAWKNVLRRKAAIILQSIARMLIAKEKYIRFSRAVLTLQTLFRGRKCRISYRVAVAAVQTLQRIALGKLARIEAKKLRNPFNRMTYDELIDAVNSVEAELKAALDEQNFARCDELEVSKLQIATARARSTFPTRVPTNRTETELFIKEVTFALASAIENGNNSLSHTLTNRKAELEDLRKKYPTSAEVSAEIDELKSKLDAAKAKKLFKTCRDLNESITALSERLKAIVATEDGAGSLTLVELSQRREKLEISISEALEAQDFDLCDKLQAEVDALLPHITLKQLTKESGNLRQNEIKAEISSAKELQDFLRMARLQTDLDKISEVLLTLETTVPTASAEAVEEITPEIAPPVSEAIAPQEETVVIEPEVVVVIDPYEGKNYEELSDLINSYEEQLDQAVKNKEYLRCSEIEKIIEDIKNSRAKLPPPERKWTRNELEVRISELSTEISTALQAKNYILCNELNAEQELLKAKLEALPTAASLALKIRDLENQLQEMIATKQYTKCADIEKELEPLKALHSKIADEEAAAAKLLEPVKAETLVVEELSAAEDLETKKNRPVIPVKISKPVKIIQDNVSNATSNLVKIIPPIKKPVAEIKVDKIEKPVSKLRPKAPITVDVSSTILEVTKKMAAARADAALLLDADGGLAGILTDNDITRRVVSKNVDPATTLVSEVMTKDPKCVHAADSALDALEMMVDNRFRHLPVLDEDGAVTGLLDIAKCLYEAVSALEKVQEKDGSGTGAGPGTGSAIGGEALAAILKATASSSGRNSNQNQAQLLAMQALMQQMFGESVPTLRSIIGSEKVPCVSPSATVREASLLMASVRKGVLVMDKRKGALLGIFTPKDLLSRVVSKGLSPDETLVSSVMTANPDKVSPELTLLDALREMHDHKFLHLPVCENDGKVVGLVDVMELICHTAGGGEGSNGKGWRDFFSGALDARGDDTMSQSSGGSSPRALHVPAKLSFGQSIPSPAPSPPRQRIEKPVAKLRPKAAVIAGDDMTVSEVAKLMAAKRADAALLLNDTGTLSGIITDNDITRRVVSQFIDPSITKVNKVMTANPSCVKSSDSALDALEMMVDKKFRHLPVLGEGGEIVGLLDIAKCLYEAISILEKIHEKENSAEDTENKINLMSTAVQVVAANGGVTNNAQMKLMQDLMKQMFGDTVPTLRRIIGSHEFPSIMHTKNVRDASILMTKHRKGLLVLDEDDDLVGILTPKDILYRVLVANKSPDLTAVASVMTASPDTVLPELTLLDALREMHDHKYLHLPVCESDGKVVGLVDVMELMGHTAGGESGGKGWRNFFSGAMDANGDDELSERASSYSEPTNLPPIAKKITTKYSKIMKYETSSDVFPIDAKQMSSFDEHEGSSDMFPVDYDFKVTDQEGHIHKFKSSSESFDALKQMIAVKMKATSDQLLLKFIDEENDEILLDSDSSLRHAVDNARRRGGSALKINVTLVAPVSTGKDSEKNSAAVVPSDSVKMRNTVIMASCGVVVLATLATVAFVFARKK